MEELCGAQAPAIGSGPTGADYSDGLLGAAGLAVAPLAFAATQASAQCAMCGSALQGDDPLARGIFWSVLFLISLPYAIVGGFVAVFVWLSRRGKTRRAPLTRGLSLVVGRKENAK